MRSFLALLLAALFTLKLSFCVYIDPELLTLPVSCLLHYDMTLLVQSDAACLQVYFRLIIIQLLQLSFDSCQHSIFFPILLLCISWVLIFKLPHMDSIQRVFQKTDHDSLSLALTAATSSDIQLLMELILLEKEPAARSGILAWEIPWTEEPGGYSPWSHRELDMTEHISTRS